MIANALSLDSSFFNVYFSYLHGDNDSHILNVFKRTLKKKRLNTMQNLWAVQNRQQIFAFCLLWNTGSFITTILYFWLERGPFGRKNLTCGASCPH